MERLK
jgi:hypothetical protein